MRSRIAYSLAAGCLLLTLASLALWAASLWRCGWIAYGPAPAGTYSYHMAALEWGIVDYLHGSGPAAGAWLPGGCHAFLVSAEGARRERWADWSIGPSASRPSGGYESTHVALAGFGVEHARSPLGTVTTIHLPLWFTAAVPALFAYRLFRRARPAPPKGLCPRCGYDVRVQRAGEGGPRCPECGTDLPVPPPHDATA